MKLLTLRHPGIRRWVEAGIAAAVLAAGGAAPGEAAGGELAWPAGDPRVLLESTIELDRAARGAKLLRWVIGEDARRESVVARPYGVAWDGNDLVVTDPDGGRVLRLRRRGRRLVSPPGAVGNPIGVAVCRRGIVVTDSVAGRVALLDARLHRVAWLAEELARPTGVGCSGKRPSDERIYVVETGAHRVLVLAADGSRRILGGRGSEPGRFNFPTSLAVDASGALWVGDTLNFRVQRLDPDSGEVLASFGRLGDAPGEMPRLKGLALDAAGQLWLADAHLDQVSIYRATDGTFLMDLGRSGEEPGEFLFPAGIAAGGDGRVAVVDSYNRRVQVFRLAGSPATKSRR